MGTPVVTLPGARPVSRQTHAILVAIGHPEWSARNEDDYVAIATALAADPDRRRALRRQLPAQMQASALCDAQGFARALETVYRGMWTRYLSKGF